MKVIGLKDLKITSLKLPGDWKRRLKTPSAESRGRSLEKDGLIQEPVVRRSDKLLIAGRDRVAGAQLQGWETILCKLVECDDDEAKRIELIENLERRHDPDEQAKLTQDLIDLLAAEEEEKEDPEEEEVKAPKRRGRKKGSRRKAMERVAEARGVKPDSVRQAEYRRKLKEQEEQERKAKEAGEWEEQPPIDTIGMELDPESWEHLAAVQDVLRSAANRVQAAQGDISRLKVLDFPTEILERAREALKSVGSLIRAQIPDCLCPYCKDLAPVRAQCGYCDQLGWIPKRKRESVPEELWDEEDITVMYQGELRAATDFDEEQEDDEAEDDEAEGDEAEGDDFPF